MITALLFPNMGHQYFFSGLVAAEADQTTAHNARLSDPDDLGPNQPLLTNPNLLNTLGETSRKNAWQAAPNAPYVRYRLGRCRYIDKNGQPYSIYGIWFAIETNLGTSNRGYVIPYEGGQTAVPPYAAADENALRAPFAPVVASFGPALDNDIPASHRTVELVWQKPATTRPVGVDLVIDFGNSRTTVFALESRERNENEIVEFPRICRPVGFLLAHDGSLEIPRPTRGHAEPFLIDSWFVFHEPNFSAFENEGAAMIQPIYETAKESRGFGLLGTRDVKRVKEHVARMPQAFVELSPTVLGPWARDLLSESTLPSTDTTKLMGGRLFMSSPKRYAWDSEHSFSEGTYWTMALHPWTKHNYQVALPALQGEVLRFVYWDDRPWSIDKVPTRDKPHYRPSRNSEAPFHARGFAMTLTALAIIESAYRQITSHRWRHEYGDALPRTLRTIQVTFPPGWTADEIENYKSKWQNAINIFAHTRIPLNPDGTAVHDNLPVPQLRMSIDEAVAAQLPIVYTQIRNLGNDAAAWAKLYGRTGAAGSVVRVMSVDIGGGTTDTSIVEYRVDSRAHNVNLNAKLVFKDSSTVAGDRLVKTMIEKALLPSLATPLKSEDKGRVRGAFVTPGDSDREREERAIIARLVFLPLVVKWLQDLSAGRKTSPEGSYWSMNSAGCDVNAVEKLRRLLDRAAIPLEVDTSGPFQVNYEVLAASIGETFGSLVSMHGQLVAAYECDMVIITGKPSELPQVKALFESELPLPASRILGAKGYHTQAWFPLTADGTIPDAKLVTAVGAALARAIDRGGVAGWEPIGFETAYAQRYCWGHMPADEGPFAERDLLIADKEEIDIKEGKLIVTKSSRPEFTESEMMTDNTYIGRHLFRSSEGRPEQVYHFRRVVAAGQKVDGARPIKVKVRLSRDRSEIESGLGSTERLVIEDVLEGDDEAGQPLTRDDVELRLCTLMGGTHWLDNGQFDMKLE